MKKVIQIISISLLSILFFSCASIPEPSEKNIALVYGRVSLNFNGIASNHGMPESDVTKSGITVKVKNVKTKKSYIARSNTDGEFTFAGLPEGTYSVFSITKSINAKTGFKADVEIQEIKHIKERYYFKVQEPGVINLGQIDINIQVTSVEVGYFYYRFYPYWKYKYNETKDFFYNNHPESDWVNEPWYEQMQTMTKKNNE